MKKNGVNVQRIISLIAFASFFGIQLYFVWQSKPIEGVFLIIYLGSGLFALIEIFAFSIKKYRTNSENRYLFLSLFSLVFILWGLVYSILTLS